MATTRIASGYVTIVDLNDGRNIQAYTKPSKGHTQIYNPDTATYTPDYTVTPQVITPVVLVSGETTDQVSKCVDFDWEVNGKGPDESGWPTGCVLSGTENSILTINTNIDPGKQFLEISWACKYRDITGVLTPVKGGITLNLTKSGGSMALVQIECPDGNTFDQGIAGIKTLTAVAKLFRGSKQDTTVDSMTWQFLNMANNDPDPWDDIPESSGKVSSVLADGVSTLTVAADDVLNFQTFRCKVKDRIESTDVYSNVITFFDATDPYTVEVYTETGDKILNGQGSTTIYARVWRDGQMIEDTKTLASASSAKFKYVWTKFDLAGNQKKWNEGQTDESYIKEDPTCTVLASEVTGRCTVFCTVNRK